MADTTGVTTEYMHRGNFVNVLEMLKLPVGLKLQLVSTSKRAMQLKRMMECIKINGSQSNTRIAIDNCWKKENHIGVILSR